MPLTWIDIAQLIINLGLPAAEKLIDNITNKTPVTPEEFQKVRDLADRTGQDRMKAALTQAGITLNDPKAQVLISLTEAPPVLVPPPPVEPPAAGPS